MVRSGDRWLTTLPSGLAAAGGGLNFVRAQHRPFSLLDVTISFPFVPESISITTVGLVALLAPAAIIALITLLLLPASSARRTLKRSQVWRRTLWELHVGLAGLALSVALGFFITQGLKNIFAKPRPHFLALCEPDLSNVAAHVVGGYGQDISARWTLVDASICARADKSILNDGFRSFPSGHCSFSWSGLLYLSLFLCAKFAIAIPPLPLSSTGLVQLAPERATDSELLPLHYPPNAQPSSQSKPPQAPVADASSDSGLPIYNQAAAPPTYGLLLALIPLGVATYISSTRYAEFWHFGFDVIGGSVIGIVSAWLAFRWYHLPIQRGQGWAWGPRSAERAFGIGVGVGSYVGPELGGSERSMREH